MTPEHSKSFFATIDDHALSLVETLHTTVAHLAQAAQQDLLSIHIASLLQEHAFTIQQVDNESHRIYGKYATKETHTLLLFSHCPPQRDALTRWGAFVIRLLTFALYHKTIGSIPLNIIWLIDVEEHNENDEEPSQWLAKNRLLLQADGCLYDMQNDVSLPAPCLAFGMKGVLSIEISVETASHEQHAIHSAILPDAAWRLTWALNCLKNAHEEIHIEGFYETLVPMEDEEIELLRSMQHGEQALKQHLNVDEFLLHLHGFQLYYTYLLLPTCTVISLHSGSTHATPHTIPSFAKASLDIHLVPDQAPEDIYNKLRKHLDLQGFQDVQVKVLASRSPQYTSLRNPFAKHIYECAYALYGESMSLFPLMPQQTAYYPFKSLLAIPVVYTQIGYVQDQLYEHDTVTPVADKERQMQFLMNGMKHTVMVIEGVAYPPDTA
ncbi:MAG: hypothetical protein NVS4B1_01300 [Ktedonobacteraceae bacterium]